MKLYKLIPMAALLLCAGACSNDDDPDYAAEVAGRYEGYTAASCAYFTDMCANNEQFTLTAVGGAADLSFTSATWGTVLAKGLSVEPKNGAYVISGVGTAVMGHAGSTSNYDCTIEGVIRSKNDVELLFTLPPQVMGGLTIGFASGTAPAELVLPGSYKGYSKASFTYAPNGMFSEEEETVSIAAAAAGFTITYESAQWGSFEAQFDAAYDKATDSYTFADAAGTVLMGMGETKSEYAFTVSGSVNTAKDTFAFVFSLPAVMGGLTIELPVEKPAEN